MLLVLRHVLSVAIVKLNMLVRIVLTKTHEISALRPESLTSIILHLNISTTGPKQTGKKKYRTPQDVKKRSRTKRINDKRTPKQI